MIKTIKKIALTDCFFESVSNFYILRDDNDLIVFDFLTHRKIATLVFGGRNVYQLAVLGDLLFVSQEVIEFETSRTIRINLKDLTRTEYEEVQFSSLVELGRDDGTIYAISSNSIWRGSFSQNNELSFTSLNIDTLSFGGLSYYAGRFLAYDFIEGKLVCLSACGDIIWSTEVSTYQVSKVSSFTSNIFYSKSKAYATTYESEIVCFSASKGDEFWSYKGCSSVATRIYGERIYSFYKGKFLVLDANTGELITSKRLELGLSESEQDDLTLFQLLVTETHAWCAFLGGRGLQAINLETFSVDWSGFEGRTLNVPPQLRNNYMFLNFMDGGIGIGENSGSSNFMLEGVGGYNQSAGTDQFHLS